MPASESSTHKEGPTKSGAVRQSLSCVSCRRRKVKCDRTKPCSACCARGNPNGCHFVVVDGGDFTFVQQSYEIRELRRENKRLKEQLREEQENNSGHSDDAFEPGVSRISRAEASRKRRLLAGSTTTNIPGPSTTLAEAFRTQFTNLPPAEVAIHGLAQTTGYPFPCLRIGENTTAALTGLLPSRDEVLREFEEFRKIAQSLTVQQTPDTTRKTHAECFLNNVEENATRSPDTLAMTFAVLAFVRNVRTKKGRQPLSREDSQASFMQSECYIAASMQALRNASFLNEPSLTCVRALLVIGLYLTKHARFQDAWSLFGLTVRLAQTIGLHRDPDTLEPPVSCHERAVRRSTWWFTIYSDQYLSTMLCRPICISSIGDCPPEKPSTINTIEVRLSNIVHEFTIVSRRILSSEGSTSPSKLRAFTSELLALWKTMPEALQFDERWLRSEETLPEWPLDTVAAKVFADIQFLIVLLNTQASGTPASRGSVSPTNGTALPNLPSSASTDPHSPIGQDLNRPFAINGSIHVLRAFLYLFHRQSTEVVCHLCDSQALHAATVLLDDAWETSDESNLRLVENVRLVFVEMQLEDGSLRLLPNLAVERISKGLARLANRREERERINLKNQCQEWIVMR